MRPSNALLAAVAVFAILVGVSGCNSQNPTSQTSQAPASGAGGSGVEFVRGYPTDATAQKALDDSDFSRAVQAYRFWYPAVSNEGIFQGLRDAGIQDNVSLSIGAGTPIANGFTLNADTPYGSGVIDVSQGPYVIEFPAGAYIGLADDHNQSWILDMGLPGPYGPKGGKHLILPPNYKGPIPAGYAVGHSATNKVLIAVRAIPVGGNAQAALESLRTIKIHPLNANDKLVTFVDTSGKPLQTTCLSWEDNLQYWQKLKKIIDEEPVSPADPATYGLLEAIGIEKGKPFNPDARMKEILERAAKTGRDEMLVSAYASNRSDRFGWPDRKWEWAGLLPNVTQFETPMGLDLEARDRWFIQAIVTSPAMFRRTQGAGSLYWGAYRDSSGAFLDGGKTYKLTVPQPVPGKLFWSVTAYDSQTRSMVVTDQNKAALRSLFELKDKTNVPSLDLYFGPAAPAGHENEWIKTSPGKGWFAYFRIYGPDTPAFDGSWKPADFVEVK